MTPTAADVDNRLNDVVKTVSNLDRELNGHIQGEKKCRGEVEALAKSVWGDNGLDKTVGKIETNVAVILERVSTNRWVLVTCVGLAGTVGGGVFGAVIGKMLGS